MNIVVAPDSFKGSLTSIGASKIIERAILEIDDNCIVCSKPMADGGEGTLDSLLTATKSLKIPIACTGPLGKIINTHYAIVDSNTAIIEGASIAGLIQVPPEQRNHDNTTSYGIGEVMIDALEKGCSSFVIGIGGSATNDGGLGMLLALGMKAWNKNGESVGTFGRDLHDVEKIDFSQVDQRLFDVAIKVACDVDNPLCDERGATAVYGPQKGATDEQIKHYDQSLNRYSDIIESILNKSLKNIEGAGAAGGIGFALLAIGAHLVSGAKLLADTIRLEDAIRKADLVITGEGQSDEQTLFGKAPGYVATLAKKHGVPTVLISGSITGDGDALREVFSGCFSIVTKPISLKESMDKAEALLFLQTKQIMHLIHSIE